MVLHEWLGDHVNWEPVLPYLPLDRHTLVFMDLRGYAAAYKQVTFETLDDAGHYAMLETPVRVAAIIEKQVAAAG